MTEQTAAGGEVSSRQLSDSSAEEPQFLPVDRRVELTVRNRQVLHDGPIFQLRRDEVELSDGVAAREYLVHRDAVAVLALDDADRVLLLSQYRHPVGKVLWELPAGLLDVPGESGLEAAARELGEEADLRADRWSQLAEFYATPGSSSQLITVYLARGLRPTGTVFARVAEEAQMEQVWVPLSELVGQVLRGELRNPTTVVGVMAAAAARAAGREPGLGTSRDL